MAWPESLTTDQQKAVTDFTLSCTDTLMAVAYAQGAQTCIGRDRSRMRRWFGSRHSDTTLAIGGRANQARIFILQYSGLARLTIATSCSADVTNLGDSGRWQDCLYE